MRTNTDTHLQVSAPTPSCVLFFQNQSSFVLTFCYKNKSNKFYLSRKQKIKLYSKIQIKNHLLYEWLLSYWQLTEKNPQRNFLRRTVISRTARPFAQTVSDPCKNVTCPHIITVFEKLKQLFNSIPSRSQGWNYNPSPSKSLTVV